MAASTANKSLALFLFLFLSLTLLSSTLVSACGTCGWPVLKPPSPPKPTPSPPKPTPSPPAVKKCPLNTLKLEVFADILGVVNVIIGSPSSNPCCSLIQGLTDLQAALCLCTALKANALGINLNVPISPTVILDACPKTAVPSGFQCP